ncbi:probable G-protein coupled receptor 141 [Salarias fasciatus]|uniref:probable G-protein coupled receptor 141 n=1 Tax=Salarias fasciatus TaxID=181472 RepID=UPI001176C8CD|nr:probable G-protein coupled receptor 141 [Salarias fasciatus]
MASNETQSTPSTTAFSTIQMRGHSPAASRPAGDHEEQYHVVLQVIYSVVLLCGTISLSLMMHALKSSSVSATSIAVLNLIFAHFIFLITVPFRIYYYTTNQWVLGIEWCKMVSSMIHIHMFMSFVLYVIILISRLLTFYNRSASLSSLQRTYALIISALVWIVVLVTTPCIVHLSYGNKNDGNNTNSSTCFDFGEKIKAPPAKVFNYIVSTFIIVVSIILMSLQANVLRILYRKYQKGCTSRQEFGAQLKSLCFALIMVVCFVPYHIFRLYYLENIHCQNENEVFLSVTTFNCLDMLTFMGRRTCSICSSCRTK